MGTLLPLSISADPLDLARVPRPESPQTPEAAPRRWDLATLRDGLTEMSNPQPAAGFTAAAILLREAQTRGEPAAWIAAGSSLFHAPDLQAWGLDLDALPVVRVRGSIAGARAGEQLLRSGAFGLVVLDLGHDSDDTGTTRPRRGSSLPTAAQIRLSALCRRHHAAFLLLARKPAGAPPVASMAVLRAEGEVHRTGFDQFTVRLHIRKDKRRTPGWSHEEILRGPDGLC